MALELGAVHILRNAVGGGGGFHRTLLFVTGRGGGGSGPCDVTTGPFFVTKQKNTWATFFYIFCHN